MLNVHFNGEIIRCPDKKKSFLITEHRRSCERRCHFGDRIDSCEAYNSWQSESPKIRNNYNSCDLYKYPKEFTDKDGNNWKQYGCPKAQKRWIASITPKKFKIDNLAYRKMSSAAHWMIKESLHKTIFITLTFPKFKNDEITETQANECFSRFTDSLKKTYDCTDYIAVRERGEENNRLHYHLLCSLPFVHFGSLNDAWCSAISDYCEHSNSAIQSRRGHRVIKNPIRAIRYVCKYIAKAKGTKSDTRLYFISNNTLKKPFAITGYQFNLSDVIEKFKSIHVKQFDFVTRFRITDRNEFNKFCIEFLYPLFECSIKPSGLYFDTGNMEILQ